MELWVQRWKGSDESHTVAYSLHQRREDIEAFVGLPDVSHASEPYLAVVDDEALIRRVLNTAHGDWIPDGTACPPA